MRCKGLLLAAVAALGISLAVPSVSQAGPFGFFGGRNFDGGAFFYSDFYGRGFFANRGVDFYPSYSVYYGVPNFPNAVVYSTSAYTPTPAPAFAKDRAYLTIQLPVDKADIWIEGAKSVQDKRSQAYVSPTIEPGKKYFYEVRAHWTDAKGKAVEMKRSFPIFAGTPVMVDFTKPQAPAASAKLLAGDAKPHEGMVVKTGDGKITLSFKGEKDKTYNVAKDAKIMLDGKDSKLRDLKANFFVKVFWDDKFVVTKIDAKSKEN